MIRDNRKKHIPQTFCKANTTLISKLDRATARNENYRPLSVINTDANMPSQTLVSPIQQYIKRI